MKSELRSRTFYITRWRQSWVVSDMASIRHGPGPPFYHPSHGSGGTGQFERSTSSTTQHRRAQTAGASPTRSICLLRACAARSGSTGCLLRPMSPTCRRGRTVTLRCWMHLREQAWRGRSMRLSSYCPPCSRGVLPSLSLRVGSLLLCCVRSLSLCS